MLCALAGWARVTLPDPFPSVAGLRPGPDGAGGSHRRRAGSRGSANAGPLVLQRVGAGARGAPRLWRTSPFPSMDPPRPSRPAITFASPAKCACWEPFRNPGDGSARTAPPDAALLRHRAREGSWKSLPRVPAAVVAPDPPLDPRGHRAGTSRRSRARSWRGSLIGERRQLPPTLLEDFRRAGVYHVLAISGFNVALVAGSVFLLLPTRAPPRAARRRPRTRDPRRVRRRRWAASPRCSAPPSWAASSSPRVSSDARAACGTVSRRRFSRCSPSTRGASQSRGSSSPSRQPPGSFISGRGSARDSRRGVRGRSPSALSVSAGAQLGVTPVTLLQFGQLSPLGVGRQPPGRPARRASSRRRRADPGGGRPSSGLLAHPLFQSLWLLLVAPPPGRARRRRAARRDRLPGAATPSRRWFSSEAVATAVRLAARRRRGIHVLVTITVPTNSPIDAALPERGGARGVADRLGARARRPARDRPLGEGAPGPGRAPDRRGGARDPGARARDVAAAAPRRPRRCSARRSRPC